MKTNFDISKETFDVVNSAAVNALLDGLIYREKRKQYNTGDSLLRDIVIKPLTINGEFIQQGVIMVNCYCRDLSNGTPDITQLEAISKAVITEFENYIQDPTKDYLSYEIMQPGGVMQEKLGESYNNLRIKFNIQQ